MYSTYRDINNEYEAFSFPFVMYPLPLKKGKTLIHADDYLAVTRIVAGQIGLIEPRIVRATTTGMGQRSVVRVRRDEGLGGINGFRRLNLCFV